MILRMWRAQSTVEKAGEYIGHATTNVFPALRAFEGHRGAYLLRHTRGDTIELVVLTLWESMHAVRSSPARNRIEPLSSQTPEPF
jgi:heme-degrading monooxygenase HmoA